MKILFKVKMNKLLQSITYLVQLGKICFGVYLPNYFLVFKLDDFFDSLEFRIIRTLS